MREVVLRVPNYWQNETSGVLRPAIEAYLDPSTGELQAAHAALLRAYLKQWMAGDWKGPRVPDLRGRISQLSTRDSFARWFADAAEDNIDPL